MQVHNFTKQGFTLIELLVSMVIMTLIFSLATVNYSNMIPRANTQALFETLKADIKSQQLKAMQGFKSPEHLTQATGVHFNSDSYVLFMGDNYDPDEQTNIVIEIQDQITLQTSPNTIVFEPGSGEIRASIDCTVVIDNELNDQDQSFFINPYGVIDVL